MYGRRDLAFAMRTPAQSWALPRGQIHPPRGLTVGEIAEVQSAEGVVFPEFLREMLSFQRRGDLWGTNWKAPGGMGHTLSAPTRIRSMYRDEVEWIEAMGLEGDLDLLLGFDAENGHDVICLDYRAGGPRSEPAITLVDTEGRSDSPMSADFVSYMSELVSYYQGAVFVSAEVSRSEIEDFLQSQHPELAVSKSLNATRYGDWEKGVSLLRNEVTLDVENFYRRPLLVPEDPDCGWIIDLYPRDGIDRIETEIADDLAEAMTEAGFALREQPFPDQPTWRR